MAAKKETMMPAESGMEEYFIVGSNFGGGGTLTAKGSKKVVCVSVCACVYVCLLTMKRVGIVGSKEVQAGLEQRAQSVCWERKNCPVLK